MRRKIIGATVGTPTSPQKIAEKLKPVKTVNGIAPDENGNVEVVGGSGGAGADGFSPVANVTQTNSGAVISITDKYGTTTATVTNGKDGKDGQDGYTPQKNVDYFDGKDGSNGADGVSPTVAVSKSGKVTTVSITDKNGTKTATINDGADGAAGSAGKDGVSATHAWNGTTLTVTSASGTSSANLKGEKGDTGAAGNTSVEVLTKAEFSAITESAAAQLYSEGIRMIIVEDGYTNLVPKATDSAGNIYRGCGYANGYRLTSSGGMSAQDNTCVSGFMPYTHGSTIRIVGSCGDALSYGGQYVGLYNANYQLIKMEYASDVNATWEPRADGLWEMTIDTSKMSAWSSAKYFRVSCVMCVGSDMVVTVNEPIGLEV
jgi:hypothetical protein